MPLGGWNGRGTAHDWFIHRRTHARTPQLIASLISPSMPTVFIIKLPHCPREETKIDKLSLP